MKMFLKVLCAVLMISSPIFCMNQAIVQAPNQAVKVGIADALPLAYAATQAAKAPSVSTYPQQSKSSRVYLKCGESSPEQISWAINEQLLKIPKDSFGYSVRVNATAAYLLHKTTADNARLVLSLFNKQHPIFHNSECIDKVRKQNVYFNGIMNIVLNDFFDKVEKVNSFTLDALLLEQTKQIPSAIEDYIQNKLREYYNKLREHYLKPVDKITDYATQKRILGSIYSKELYGQGYEVTADSIRISNDGRFIKAVDIAGNELIWEINTAERAFFSSPSTYWTPMTNCATDIPRCVLSEKEKCMAMVVKDKKMTHGLIPIDYSRDEHIPALVLAVMPTWRDEIIYEVLWGSNSIEQFQALLNSRSLRFMRTFVRNNLKDYLCYVLESAEENAELVY